MARCLSEIQKKLLILAYSRGSYLYYPDALHEIYQWSKSYPNISKNNNNMIIGRQNFNRWTVGLAKYNSGRAALSKAVSRLERRGLVIRIRYGLTLTEAGTKTAQILMANTGLPAQ